MKKLILLIIFTTLAIATIMHFYKPKRDSNSFKETKENKDTYMYRYAIEEMQNYKIKEGKIEIKETIEEKDSFTSFYFEFFFNPNLDGRTIKKTSGMINIPKDEGRFPIVIMIRGYVDPKDYKTGTGSKNLSYFLAERGFITISPDFLGYAQSDKEAENIFETRFQTYTTIISLIESAFQIEKWDRKNLFIWGHSNGGQIALFVLESTKKDIPTVLWAPVSAPFPYSILYYTIDSEDKGKFIRKELAKFEENYDTDKFSITNYFDRINTKIEIHQGGKDDSVPSRWSEKLYKTLIALKKDVKYYFYPESDHNLRPNWNEVALKTFEFYKNLTK